MLKWFCLDVQDDHYGSRLENLQITSAPEWQVVLSLNLMEASGVIEMRIAEIVRFQYLRWGPL